MKAFEHRGIWWLPEKEQNKVPGILHFTTEDGLVLELIGALGSGLELSDEPRPVILGLAEKLGEVTLGECLPSGLRIGFPGFPCESYRPAIAYVGAHFPTSKNKISDTIRIESSSTHLELSGISSPQLQQKPPLSVGRSGRFESKACGYAKSISI